VIPLGLRLGFWLALAVTTFFALLPQPPGLLEQTSDKLQHVLAFAALSVALVLAYPRLAWWRACLALWAYGGAIELVQLVPALNRTGEFADWLADAASVALVLPLSAFLRRRRPAAAPRGGEAEPRAGSG
jgi:VanZ family protein